MDAGTLLVRQRQRKFALDNRTKTPRPHPSELQRCRSHDFCTPIVDRRIVPGNRPFRCALSFETITPRTRAIYSEKGRVIASIRSVHKITTDKADRWTDLLFAHRSVAQRRVVLLPPRCRALLLVLLSSKKATAMGSCRGRIFQLASVRAQYASGSRDSSRCSPRCFVNENCFIMSVDDTKRLIGDGLWMDTCIQRFIRSASSSTKRGRATTSNATRLPAL